MNQAQEQAMMEAETRKRRAIQAGRIAAECGIQIPYTEDQMEGCRKDNVNTYTIRARDTGDLEAIMERRRLNNFAVERTYKEIIEQLHQESEDDAVRITRLEQANGQSNSAQAIIREQLRYFQGEWGPLIDAMLTRQREAERLVNQITVALTAISLNSPRELQAHTALEASKALYRVLRNEPEPKKSKEPDTLYYCPTCKRHVHPEDVSAEVDGYRYHLVHNPPHGKRPCGTVPLEVRGIDKDPPLIDAIPPRVYLARVDDEFARLGATRTAEDARAIEAARDAGHSPESVAQYLYRLAKDEVEFTGTGRPGF